MQSVPRGQQRKTPPVLNCWKQCGWRFSLFGPMVGLADELRRHAHGVTPSSGLLPWVGHAGYGDLRIVVRSSGTWPSSAILGLAEETRELRRPLAFLQSPFRWWSVGVPKSWRQSLRTRTRRQHQELGAKERTRSRCGAGVRRVVARVRPWRRSCYIGGLAGTADIISCPLLQTQPVFSACAVTAL